MPYILLPSYPPLLSVVISGWPLRDFPFAIHRAPFSTSLWLKVWLTIQSWVGHNITVFEKWSNVIGYIIYASSALSRFLHLNFSKSNPDFQFMTHTLYFLHNLSHLLGFISFSRPECLIAKVTQPPSTDNSDSLRIFRIYTECYRPDS